MQSEGSEGGARESAGARSVVVAEGDARVARLLSHHLLRAGWAVTTVASHDALLAHLRQQGAVALVLLDYDLPGTPNCEAAVRHITDGETPVGAVIVISARDSLSEAVSVVQAGAYDYVSKSARFETVRHALHHAIETLELQAQVETLRARISEPESSFAGIVGDSPAITAVKKLVRKVAETDATVLILGESGSGKELIARALHYEGRYREQPFVALNCAAIPENLLESELFGHERGAFTGATGARAGRFVEANGGTLFLDEVGELPVNLQAKLLRVLQTGEIQPVGGRTRKVRVRIVAATNRDLLQRTRAGEFREDLYYRLAVFPIEVPPLRDRPQDISLLAHHFLQHIAQQENKTIEGLHPSVLARMQAYPWRGNVRELENMIYRAVVLAETSLLQPDDFPMLGAAEAIMQEEQSPAPAAPSPAPAALPVPGAWPGGGGQEDPPQPAPPAAAGAAPEAGLPLEAMERAAILQALRDTAGNVSRAATRLGIGRATLYRKVKKYGIATTGTVQPPGAGR